MRSDLTRSRLGRRVLAALLVASSVATMSATPFTPGVSYKVRFVVSMPNMPGMNTSGDIVIAGHGVATGARSRFDIDSAQANPVSGSFGPGDFILVLDSGRVVAVSPATKTYVDGFSSGMNAMPPEMMAQASVTNVSVNVEKLGVGETIEGRPTERYRLVAQYTIGIMGQSIGIANESEVLTAQLPASINTPFSGSLPKSMASGPFAELFAKMTEAQKQIQGTPLKMTTSSSVAGPMSMTMSQSMQITDVKLIDVDDKLLQIPEGFTARPPSP